MICKHFVMAIFMLVIYFFQWLLFSFHNRKGQCMSSYLIALKNSGMCHIIAMEYSFSLIFSLLLSYLGKIIYSFYYSILAEAFCYMRWSKLSEVKKFKFNCLTFRYFVKAGSWYNWEEENCTARAPYCPACPKVQY